MNEVWEVLFQSHQECRHINLKTSFLKWSNFSTYRNYFYFANLDEKISSSSNVHFCLEYVHRYKKYFYNIVVIDPAPTETETPTPLTDPRTDGADGAGSQKRSLFTNFKMSITTTLFDLVTWKFGMEYLCATKQK